MELQKENTELPKYFNYKSQCKDKKNSFLISKPDIFTECVFGLKNVSCLSVRHQEWREKLKLQKLPIINYVHKQVLALYKLCISIIFHTFFTSILDHLIFLF